MKLKHICFGTVLAASLAGSATAKDTAAPVITPAARANAVAFKFFASEGAAPGNLFFSPYSLHTAFAMAYEGAKGKTAKEIASVFSLPAKTADLRKGLAELGKETAAAAEGAEFSQANSFWAQDGYKFLPAYLAALRGSYSAEARNADFQAATEKARGDINSWTEERTKGKIKDLFKEGTLTPLTRLVLVNAVYFKGKWQEPFKKEMTAEADFTRSDGQIVKARMMGFPGTRDLEYGEVGDFQLLRLPYQGGRLAMLVALPKKGKPLAEAAKGFDAAALGQMRKALAKQKVKVFLPRFSFDSGFELNGTLSALGMPTAFTDAADFSGMDGTRKLYVQRAVHKAFVEVNEEGTEAAAATGVAMGLKSMPAFDFQVFRADRPFLFFIEEPKSGLLLFMGRVEEPKEK